MDGASDLSVHHSPKRRCIRSGSPIRWDAAEERSCLRAAQHYQVLGCTRLGGPKWKSRAAVPTANARGSDIGTDRAEKACPHSAASNAGRRNTLPRLRWTGMTVTELR